MSIVVLRSCIGIAVELAETDDTHGAEEARIREFAVAVVDQIGDAHPDLVRPGDLRAWAYPGLKRWPAMTRDISAIFAASSGSSQNQNMNGA
jgi:hypothetical protein